MSLAFLQPTRIAAPSAEALEKIGNFRRWYHKFEIFPGILTAGEYQLPTLTEYLAEFGISSLEGKRVLDVATFDGGWAFMFERAGAEVVAMDLIDQSRTGFRLAHDVTDSSVQFFNRSVYDIAAGELGTFDFVHYSGLHYHLKHPQLALDKINGVLRMGGTMFGHGTSGEYHYRTSYAHRLLDGVIRKYLMRLPVAYFLDGSYGHDPTNWFLFSDRCMEVMMQRAGFRVDRCRSRVPHDFGHRTACYFKATKIAEPDPEYWPDNHKQMS